MAIKGGVKIMKRLQISGLICLLLAIAVLPIIAYALDCDHEPYTEETQRRMKYTPYNPEYHCLIIEGMQYCSKCYTLLGREYIFYREEAHEWNSSAKCTLCGEANRGR